MSRLDRAEEWLHIRIFLRSTWLATLLFTVAISGGALLLHPTLAYATEGAVLSLLVAPPIWWWFVGRRPGAGIGRGAIAGALILPAVWILAMTISEIAIEAQRPPGWKPSAPGAALGSVFWLIAGLGGSLMAAVGGALFGTMIAWLGRLGWSDRSNPPRSDTG